MWRPITLAAVLGVVFGAVVDGLFVPASGGALRFRGDKTHRDYVQIAPKCQADGNPFDRTNLTLAVWFRTTTSTTQEQTLIGYSVGQGPLITLSLDAAHFRGVLTSSDFATWIRPSPNLADGRWHHIALTNSPDYFAVYVDGRTFYNCTGPMQQVTRSDRIVLGVYDMAFESGNALSFTGEMDDVRVYSRLFRDDDDVFTNIMSRPPTDDELANDLILALNFDIGLVDDVKAVENQAAVPVSIDLGGGLVQRSPKSVQSTAPIRSLPNAQNGPFVIES